MLVVAILAQPAFGPMLSGAEKAPPSRADRVQSHLEAGEFGLASRVARAANTRQEQVALLRMIADAQMMIGEFDSAGASIRQMPGGEERVRAQAARAARQNLAGGNMADFGPLIQLIQNETSGKWFDKDGEGGTISEFNTGVRVDPNGLLTHLTLREHTGRLQKLGHNARVAALNDDMSRASSMRMVSITRLEKEIAKRLEEGKPVVETMKNLAGISRIQYVFVYPEENEIVIAGPAEGWKYSETGLAIGIESGLPIAQLDDLVTVLRTFQPGGTGKYGCLIVPRQEGLKKVKEYAEKSNARGPLSVGATRNFVAQLQQQLGLQDVVVEGIPADSRVSRVIVEADYRMKLIGIGRLHAGSGFPSYFDLLPKSQQQSGSSELNALRWWMTMKYDAVLHSQDRNAFQFAGASVLCLSEDELITATGERIHTGKSEGANRLFAENFTRNYAKLAKKDIVFADLQNVFDLSLVAALIRSEHLDGKVKWDLGVFAPGGRYTPARFDTPQTVMSVSNHRVYNGKNIVVQVAGGVRGDVMSVVNNKTMLKNQPRLGSIAAKGKAGNLPEGRWWWDVRAE